MSEMQVLPSDSGTGEMDRHERIGERLERRVVRSCLYLAEIHVYLMERRRQHHRHVVRH